MGDYKKGTIGTYTDPDTGEELVFLPTNVDDDGAVIGHVFRNDGTHVITIPAETDEQKEAPSVDALNSEERDELQRLRVERDERNLSDRNAERKEQEPPAPEPVAEPPNQLDLTPADGENGNGEIR